MGETKFKVTLQVQMATLRDGTSHVQQNCHVGRRAETTHKTV
jgi:hypothetical protein